MQGTESISQSGYHLDLGGAPAGFRAVSTTRAFGEACGRDLAAVAEKLKHELQLPPEVGFCFARQVHGGAVRRVPPTDTAGTPLVMPGCDGIVSRDRRLIPVVRTADCVPVIVAALHEPWVAAVHAGWRGTKARILETAIQMAAEDGIVPGGLRVWIGPCISGSVYEVSAELAEDFRREFPACEGFACGRRINLSMLNRFQALNSGIEPENITEANLCTFERETEFPSYRRDGRCRTQIYTLGFWTQEASLS